MIVFRLGGFAEGVCAGVVGRRKGGRQGFCRRLLEVNRGEGAEVCSVVTLEGRSTISSLRHMNDGA